MKKYIFFLFSIWTLFSCHKQEDSVLDGGVAIKLPTLWKTAISDNGTLAEVVVKGTVEDQQGRVIIKQK